MTAPDNTYRVQRPLTDDEIGRVTTAIDNATSSAALLTSLMETLYTALLSTAGRRWVDIGPDDRIDPTEYAIPHTQHQAITAAVLVRAAEWGTSVELGVELITLMPAHYDDAAIPTPAIATPDRRARVHTVEITRDAVDLITACERRLADLADYFGAPSAFHTEALTTWHHALTTIVQMSLGPHTRVSSDGPLSLLVRTLSGLVYSITWHPSPRRCIVSGCDSSDLDDASDSDLDNPAGTADPRPGSGAGHGHRHVSNYLPDAPTPGRWMMHS